MAALAEVHSDDAIVVLESPSCTLSLRNRLRISSPGSYYFCASGGLGFGIAAAVGVQLAQPSRPVVCVLGEGSAQYGITALWSALAYKAPVTFLILRNDEYMILKWFAMLEQVSGAPGLDLPGLDVAAVARGYGVPAQDVSGREELTEALRDGDRRRRRPAPHPGPGGLRHVARVVAATATETSTIVPEPPGPAPDRAPDWVAAGTPEPLRSRLVAALGADRVLTRALDLIRYASDASPYRLIPQAVAVPRDVQDMASLLRCATELEVPVTFRAGGTSLNGQSQTDAILVDVRRHWRRVRVEDGGARLRAQPGVVLGHANRLLARHSRRIGPDPASTNIACVGGVVANNSGGMRCGVVADSYRTVSSMTLVLANGAVIDTAARRRRAAVRRRRARAGGRPGADPRSHSRRRGAVGAHRAQVPDQEHHRVSPVRVPGRRHTARDLPAARHRLRGDARLRRRGGVRHRPARSPHDAGPGQLRGPRRRRRRGRRARRRRARPPPS